MGVLESQVLRQLAVFPAPPMPPAGLDEIASLYHLELATRFQLTAGRGTGRLLIRIQKNASLMVKYNQWPAITLTLFWLFFVANWASFLRRQMVNDPWPSADVRLRSN
jgi:hypothetical protein